MRTFQEYISEAGGKPAGNLEIAKIGLDKARAYAEMRFAENGFDLDEEIPDFNKNFQIAKVRAMMGRTKRKDMPVLEKSSDIQMLQHMLKRGSIDLTGPWSSDDVARDPFPEGLKGDQAKSFLTRGLRIFDGAKRDDIVKFKSVMVEAQKLIPIQQQIYFDKSIDKQSKEGRKGSTHFLKNMSTFISSSDLNIIDGHHRFVSALLLDPSMTVKVMMVDLPIDKLLPLALSFSDAIGNKRNR